MRPNKVSEPVWWEPFMGTTYDLKSKTRGINGWVFHWGQAQWLSISSEPLDAWILHLSMNTWNPMLPLNFIECFCNMQVAEICLAALYEPGASNKIVEVC